MPFTFAHPAAVLPFKKLCPRFLNFPALIIGSVTPDLGYYVHQWMWSVKGHSFIGIITFDVPVGLIILGALYLCAQPLSRLLPSPHRQILLSCCPVVKCPSPADLTIAVISLMAGASTHILWDGFTHANGWCVRQFAALTPTIFSVGSYNVTVWQILQHSSTVIGLVLLARAYANLTSSPSFPRDTADDRRFYKMVWAFLLGFPALVAVASSWKHLRGGFSMPAVDVFIFNSVVTYVGTLVPLVVMSAFTACVVVALRRMAKRWYGRVTFNNESTESAGTGGSSGKAGDLSSDHGA